MARPEIKNDRREQILDAFETCVARYGLEGATLGKTAEIAGLARPLIRHNVGNREDLQEALVDRFLSRSREAMEGLVESLPEQSQLTALIDLLFDPQYANPKLVLVFNALSAAAPDDQALAEKLQQWLQEFVDRLETVLRNEYPNAASQKISAVAAGVSGIYFNVEALYPIGGLGAFGEASKEAAHILIAALER